MAQQKIAILASGNGSNALKILQHFKNSDSNVNIALIATNNANAGVLKHAQAFDIPTLVFDKSNFNSPDFAKDLKNKGINWIVLAGFLWLIPANLILTFENKIINIHPSLLPKYGGKGMYGNNVHQAVLNANEVRTGITIHLVNNEYDKGAQLFQAAVSIATEDTQESIQKKVQVLEHQYFAGVVESVVLANNKA